jgi:hypothetical protein
MGACTLLSLWLLTLHNLYPSGIDSWRHVSCYMCYNMQQVGTVFLAPAAAACVAPLGCAMQAARLPLSKAAQALGSCEAT